MNIAQDPLVQAISNFLPLPTRRTIIWVHIYDREHYVGEARDIDCTGKGLTVASKWMLTVEPEPRKTGRNTLWKILPGARPKPKSIVLLDPLLRSVTEEGLEIEDNGTVLNMYISGQRVVEAQKILNRLLR